MTSSLFSLRVDAERVVAVEVSEQTAAVLLDQGHPLLLATEVDLTRLARRQRKLLWIIARRPAAVNSPNHGGSRRVKAAKPRAVATSTPEVCEVA